jgi:hypothetical protein
MSSIGPAEFSEPVPLALANGPMEDMEPFATADAVYFSSSRFDYTASLYQMRFEDGALAAPIPLLVAGSDHHDDQSPVVSADGLTLYFMSYVRPTPKDATSDVWTATRRHIDEPFGDPRRVELDGRDGRESPLWISEDLCRLYLKADWSGSWDIWVASRGGSSSR